MKNNEKIPPTAERLAEMAQGLAKELGLEDYVQGWKTADIFADIAQRYDDLANIGLKNPKYKRFAKECRTLEILARMYAKPAKA
jgi:hypothetical protein